MNIKLENIRDDRLYHVTAHWSTNQDKKFQREFMICAANKNDAECIAKNHIPEQLNMATQPDATKNIQLRIRDLGLSQKNRTYFVSEIVETSQDKPGTPSQLETIAIYFAHALGKTDMSKENITDTCWQYATEFLYQKDADPDTFLQAKLTKTDSTAVTDVLPEEPTTSVNANSIIDQAKKQAEIIIQNANTMADTIIANAKTTAAVLLETTQNAISKKTENTQPTPDAITTEPTQNIEHTQEPETTEKPQSENKQEQDNTQPNQTQPDVNDEQLDKTLTENFVKAKTWLESLSESENPNKISCNDLCHAIMSEPTERIKDLLQNKNFEYNTNIKPLDYWNIAILGDENASETDKGFTALALLASIISSDDMTLFQTYAFDYMQQQLEQMSPETDDIMPDDDPWHDELYNMSEEDEGDDTEEPNYSDDEEPPAEII